MLWGDRMGMVKENEGARHILVSCEAFALTTPKNCFSGE